MHPCARMQRICAAATAALPYFRDEHDQDDPAGRDHRGAAAAARSVCLHLRVLPHRGMGPGRGARRALDRRPARRGQPVPDRHEGGLFAALHRGGVGAEPSPADDGRFEAIHGAGRNLLQADRRRHASPLRRHLRLRCATGPPGEDVPGSDGSCRQERHGRHEAGARRPVRPAACRLGHRAGRQAGRARHAGFHPLRLQGGAQALESRVGVSARSPHRDHGSDVRVGPRDRGGPGGARSGADARGTRCEQGEARRAGPRAPVRQQADPRRDSPSSACSRTSGPWPPAC